MVTSAATPSAPSAAAVNEVAIEKKITVPPWRGGQDRAALAAGHVHADHGDVGRAARPADRRGHADRVAGVGDHDLVGQPGAPRSAGSASPLVRDDADDLARPRPGGRPPPTASRSCPPRR